MGHLHSIYDTDSHFKVNATTRAITDVSNSKNSIVQYDHGSERFTFEIPRYIEGHDMLQCNDVDILWQNGSASGKYSVDDFQVSPEDENIVICSWLISRESTQYTGTLQFQLRLSCVTETEPDYVWNTAVYSKINVLRGFSNENEGTGGGGGGGDGGSSDPALPSGGTVGQVLTKTATGSEWADAPEAEDELFIVTATYDVQTSKITALDKTAAEVLAAYNAGKTCVMRGGFAESADDVSVQYAFQLPLVMALEERNAEDGTIEAVFSGLYGDDGMSVHMVNQDGEEYFELVLDDFVIPGSVYAVPRSGTEGQVLTMGANGIPAWADPVTVASAEGVEFG